MIEYALLVVLGFCAAGLLALLIAPTIWRRAVRLTTKRLDATLPMSLSDIEADKDLLRASYAIQIRRLEAGLNKARDKSASQLVEISRLQIVIGELRDRIGGMERQLEERSNAANVFERTIKKRFPELEAQLTTAKDVLDERAFEITDLSNTIRRKEEALSLIQRSSNMQQVEIRKLREAMEGASSDKTGRFKKRPAQWTLEEFRSEYDRLNLELSKMREQLSLAQERESGQVAVLKGELQSLAQQIMTAVANQERQLTEQKRLAEAAPPPVREEAPRPNRRTPADRSMSAPQPWPRRPESSQPRTVEEPKPAPGPARDPARAAAPDLPPAAPMTAPTVPSGAPQPSNDPRAPKSERTYMRPSERRPSITSEAAASGARPEAGALKTLLNRAATVAAKSGADAGLEAGPPPAAVQPVVPTPPEPAPVKAAPALLASPSADKPAAPATAAVARAEAVPAETATPASPPVSAAKASEPNIDRMLREIFEGREAGQPVSAANPVPEVEKAPAAPADAKEKAADDSGNEADADKKPSLLERLRVV
jgi:hypothetical protein